MLAIPVTGSAGMAGMSDFSCLRAAFRYKMRVMDETYEITRLEVSTFESVSAWFNAKVSLFEMEVSTFRKGGVHF